MPLTKLLEKARQFEIQSYNKLNHLKELKENHIPFTGSPRKHPYDIEKFILLADPYSSNTFYYEFNIQDITFIEELPNIVTLEDETITMIRIWVKKASIGVRCSPFIVEHINI